MISDLLISTLIFILTFAMGVGIGWYLRSEKK